MGLPLAGGRPPANGPSANPTITARVDGVLRVRRHQPAVGPCADQGRSTATTAATSSSGPGCRATCRSSRATPTTRSSNNRAAAPHGAARNPAASYYGNYVAWESPYPLVDRDAAAEFGPMDDFQASQASHADPRLHQVYLRYIGPA